MATRQTPPSHTYTFWLRCFPADTVLCAGGRGASPDHPGRVLCRASSLRRPAHSSLAVSRWPERQRLHARAYQSYLEGIRQCGARNTQCLFGTAKVRSRHMMESGGVGGRLLFHRASAGKTIVASAAGRVSYAVEGVVQRARNDADSTISLL